MVRHRSPQVLDGKNEEDKFGDFEHAVAEKRLAPEDDINACEN